MEFTTNLHASVRRGTSRIRSGLAIIGHHIRCVMSLRGPGPSNPVTFSDRLEQRWRLEQALRALQARRFDEAETLLSEARQYAPHDCVAWNLLGAVHECRGEWKQARRCYGKAVADDKRFAPAQQNLRRLYELYTFGHSQEPLAFGMTLRHWQAPDISLMKGMALSTHS